MSHWDALPPCPSALNTLLCLNALASGSLPVCQDPASFTLAVSARVVGTACGCYTGVHAKVHALRPLYHACWSMWHEAPRQYRGERKRMRGRIRFYLLIRPRVSRTGDKCALSTTSPCSARRFVQPCGPRIKRCNPKRLAGLQSQPKGPPWQTGMLHANHSIDVPLTSTGSSVIGRSWVLLSSVDVSIRYCRVVPKELNPMPNTSSMSTVQGVRRGGLYAG